MKDYSEWKVILDYENDSPYVDSNRPWLKSRPLTVPKTIKFDPIPVHEFIKQSTKKYPNNVCVYHKSTDKKYTYRELNYNADRIANALYGLGIGKGDSVCIMSGNSPEFLFCVLGILETGAAVVPINPLLKEEDIIHIIRESGNVKAFFIFSPIFRYIKKAKRTLAKEQIKVENIILLEATEAKEDSVTLEEFIEGVSPKQPDIDIDPDNDIAALLFTGGTTGLPKGVMLTHTNLVADSISTIYNTDELIEELEVQAGTGVNLSILPLCHTFGFTIVIIMLRAVMMLVIFASFDPAEVLEAIDYYKIKLFVGVPVMFQMIINHPDFTERDLSSIERAASGSAALAPELSRKWEEVVGIKVGQGYGLTESSPITHAAVSWMDIIAESIGIPLIDTDAKIVNPDTLDELPAGKIGELLIRGRQVMKGYWQYPEVTAKTIVNGWLRTGDLARMDEKGYFYIEGRTKDMVKYKGYKVMPREVEEKLMEHPAVLEVGVASIPDPNIGETIKAWIVLKPEYRDKGITEREIIEWSKERLASYKYPRHVEFIRALPRTVVGKIFRRKLREMKSER